MDGPREHELTCGVDRCRDLLSIINRKHHPTDVYKALRAVLFELEQMARLLPAPPAPPPEIVQRNANGDICVAQALDAELPLL